MTNGNVGFLSRKVFNVPGKILSCLLFCSIDKNLRSTVYCNGLRFSVDINDWEFLWNKFKTETLTSEKLTLMSALGCTLDRTFLQE